ncbi:MAG: hypothetical protein PHW84_01865 [Methanosarcina sp.]|nr:hypothetical protein [Methanosarcina sp.]
MTYQTTPQNLASVRLGSAKIEVGTSSADLQDLGLVTKLEFKEKFKQVELKPDNSVSIIKGVMEHVCDISFEMWELDLTKLALLRGGMDSIGSQSSSPVSITDEPHKLLGTNIAWLDHSNGSGTEVSSIVVTDASSNAAVRNTDYVIVVGTDGRTGIARVSGSSVISDGEGVLVDYTYTPYANKTMGSGGLNTLDGRYIRLTNINSAGKKFQIDVYKARVTGGLDMSYPADDDDKALTSKIEMEGIYDTTRTVGDMLYKITDEQGVSA